MRRRFHRRDALRSGLAAISLPVTMGLTSPPAREVRAFRLVEAAGLRRFGYPVHATVPDASGGRNFRLVRDGRAIPAQFREVEGPSGRPEVALDFIASPSPLEVGQYQVLFGREVEPGPEPKGGLTLREREGRYLVSQDGTMTFEIDRDSPDFLRSVGNPSLAYLGEAPSGLRLLTKGDGEPAGLLEIGKLGIEVSRHGPMAVGLRATRSIAKVPSFRLQLTVPSSKTWVEVVATADDSAGIIRGFEFDLNLRVEGTPTLVDLGAGSTVYGQIKDGERMELLSGRAIGEADPASGPGWVVRKGVGTDPAPFAASTAEWSRPAEGWAHVMDSRRCSALALAEFGRAGARDRISAGADGGVRIVREYALTDAEPPRGPKSLAFWLHFVPMPVQVGAATSPQSILAPLRVEWDRPPVG